LLARVAILDLEQTTSTAYDRLTTLFTEILNVAVTPRESVKRRC